MKQERYEFVLEAREPISHAQESIGNVSVIMRQKVRQPDGSFAQVPIITGDTMRHGLREAASYALLECAGMLGDSLSEQALRLLFAGGMVTGSAGDSIKLDEYREMCELMPHLSLLGGCVQNRVIPGRIQVSTAVLICDETAHLTPEWVREWMAGEGALSAGARAHVEHVQRVRMDPTLDPAKRLLLAEGERARVEGRLLMSESASGEGDAVAKDRVKSTMLPFSYERVAQGSLFFWSLTATCYSDLDTDALLVMLGAFLRHARVGGKRGTGHGMIVPLVARNIALAKYSERSDTFSLSTETIGDRYRQHVAARADRIREFLGRVTA